MSEQTGQNNKTHDEGYVLEVEHLKTYYPVTAGCFKRKIENVKRGDGISIKLKRAETFGLVGVSGCGKSTAGRTILRLTDPTEGKIIFDGKDITRLRGARLRRARQDFQMVFQDPYASLNSEMMVGHLVDEPLRNFSKKSHKELDRKSTRLNSS